MKKAVLGLGVALLLAIPSTASASTSLDGWWPFYEGSGTTAHDVSGNRNTGTISNPATLARVSTSTAPRLG
jgi:hypothetical protein